MVDLSDIILIERNGTLYRSNIDGLSPIVLCIKEKDDFIEYLNDLSASLERLTANFDVVLYPKNEMKSDFAVKENISNLTANGNYVPISKATAAVNSVKDKSELYTNGDKDCWYEAQLGMTVQGCLITAYRQSINIVKADPGSHDASEWMVTPSYEELMGKIEDGKM